jgi:hypothetical protein
MSMEESKRREGCDIKLIPFPPFECCKADDFPPGEMVAIYFTGSIIS